MFNAAFDRIVRRMVSRVASPGVRHRRTVLEVTQNTLEPRLAPATLAAPIVDSTTPQFVRVGPPAAVISDFINAQTAANPENPLRQVVVAEEIDNRNGVLDSYIVAKSTIDGGATWTSFAKFGGGNQFSADGKVFRDPTVPGTGDPNFFFYRIYSNPSATVTRDGQVYISFLARNVESTSGAVAVRRYDFSPTQATPAFVTLDPLLAGGNVFRGDAASAVAYRWAAAADAAFNPTIASNPNVNSYTDPDTGTVMTDPTAGTAAGGGQVYLAWSNGSATPSGYTGLWNPGVVTVATAANIPATDAKATGQFFTAPVRVSSVYNTTPQLLGSHPQLAFTGNNSVSPVYDPFTGKVIAWTQAPGQLVTTWETTGDQPGSKFVGVDVTNVGGITIGGASTKQVAITDASKVDPGPPANKRAVTNYDVPVANTSGADLTGYTLGNVSVTLALQHPDLTQLRIELVSPTGVAYTLVQNRQDETPASLMQEPGTGVTPGLTGVDLGFVNGAAVGTTFSDDAARRVSDGSNQAPYIGTFYPDVSNTGGSTGGSLPAGQSMRATFAGVTAAAAVGNWVIRVTDFVNGPVGPPLPPRFIRSAAVNLNYAPSPALGLRQSNFNGSPNTGLNLTGLAVNTPNGVRSALALQSTQNFAYPFAPGSGIGPQGVGPGVAVAVDNGLGANQVDRFGTGPLSNPRAPLAGMTSGLMYVALTAAVDMNISGTLDAADDTDVFVAVFDTTQLDANGLPVFLRIQRLNDDKAGDNLSQGLRYQYNPALAVDPRTGTLAATFFDARYDAANVRTVASLTTSTDGGVTFSPQVPVNQLRVVTDVITGKELTVEPLPTSPIAGGTVTQGLGTNPLGVTIHGGKVNVSFAGNPNAPGGYVYTALARTAAGPQVVYGDVGAVGATVAAGKDGNSVVRPNSVQLDRPIAPTPPRFYQYNATRSGLDGQAELPGVAVGTPLLDGIRVVFDRRMDPTSFTADDVRVFFQGTGGGAPVELRTLYPDLTYRIDNLSAQTKGVLADGTGFGNLNSANIVTPDTDFVVRFVDVNSPTTLVPVGLVGTYSYALSPNIRDRIRNPQAGTVFDATGLPSGSFAIPATKTVSGGLIDPLTAAYAPDAPLLLSSRQYQQPGSTPTPTNQPVYAADGAGLTKSLSTTGIPGVGVPSGLVPVSVNGVTDVPVQVPAGVLPAGQDRIARALVQVDLVHTRRGPNTSVYEGLILQLISPGGEVIPLAVQSGGNGTEYDGFAFENTVFDSLASKALEAGGGRFRGSFRPAGSVLNPSTGKLLPTLASGFQFPTLLDLNGDAAAGTWYLRVIDNFNPDNQYGETGPNPLGYLRSWSLTLVPGSVSASPFGLTAPDKLNSTARGNPLDVDGDGAGWEPVQDSHTAPRSTAPLTLTGGPYQAGGRGLFQIGPFDKTTLPVVIGGPRVLGVGTRADDADPATAGDGRNLSDQVYVNRPADRLFVRFDRALDPASFVTADTTANNPAGLRIIGPAGELRGPFAVSANPADPAELVVTFVNSPDATPGLGFTRGGSYTVQFGAGIRSAVGDLVDTNQNAGVDRLFGGNAATAPIQTVTFGHSGGAVPIRSAPVVAQAGTQVVTGETVSEIPIPVTQAFQLAQDLTRFPDARLKLDLQIRDNDPAAVPALFSGLTADLVAPDGTRIRLFTASLNSQSGPGSVTTRITFDDAALAPAGGGINPFQTAPYNPQQPLSRLLGRWSAGTWKVVVTNTLFRIDPVTLLARDVGQIVSASLTLARAADSSGLGEPRADETSLGFRVFNQDPTSKEANQVWQAVGAAPQNNQANVGRVSAVTIDTADPTGNTVFAAGASGGVWRTTNFLTTDPDGPSWVPLTDFGPTTSLNVASIAVFPRNNDPAQSVVFALTGEGEAANLPDGNTPWTKPGVGVLRSFDGGRTWSLLDSGTNAVTAANAKTGETVGDILPVADPRRDRRFIGASGFKIIVDPTPYQTLAGDPLRTSPNNLAVYMAVSDSRPAGDANFAGGVWRSLDSGRTWLRIAGGNATDVAFAPGAVGPDGNLQTLYSALIGPGVNGGVYITRQATNVPAAGATSTGSLQRLGGGGGNNVIRDQLAGSNTAVGVNGQAGPGGGQGTRITLGVPALTNNPLANNVYQGWLYAAATNADGSFNGLYLTKDFGSNWTLVRLPEVVDAFGDFWGHNDEAQGQGSLNLVEYNQSTQFTSNVAYTRDADPLTDSPRTYVPRPGAGTRYGNTPRAAGQGSPAGDGSGGTGNRAFSLAVDPLDPAVVFLGGDRSVRVDTSVVEDAQSFYYFDNTQKANTTLLGSGAAGGVTLNPLFGQPFMANIKTGVAYPLENGKPLLTGFQWGVIVPGSANPTDTANGIAEVYRDKYGLPAGFVNLSKDPGNPFLNPSVIQVYNGGTFTNSGQNAFARPFDNILFGGYDVTSIVPFVDPQTGRTRLIYGTATGVYTGVDTAAKAGASLDVAVGDSPFVGNPTQVATVVTGPRNGNLQIGQYYSGAVQPSRLAADIAGALFYAASQDNGYPVSSAGVIETGSTAVRSTDWPGTGLSVATDQTGTGTGYQYRLPSSTGTDTTNTSFGNPADFFRLQLPGADQGASGIGRSNNLLSGQDPFTNTGNWPLNDARYGTFAANPIDGAGLAISAAPTAANGAATATVFRSIDRGLTWENLGAPAGAGQYVSALAFGGPDTRFPTQRNNYILAGTGDRNANGNAAGGSNGQVYFTVNGTANTWVRVPGDAALGGRSVQRIVPNPRFGTSDFFVLTDRGVFYVRLTLNRDNPAAVTANWRDVTGNLYDVTRTLDSYSKLAGGFQAVTALRDLRGGQLDLTALAVDWRYTNPVLYVGGDGGVFRSATYDLSDAGTAAWTLFPDNPAASYADGGFLPNARVTDLDLSLGSIEQNYDPANPGKGGMPVLGIDPATGLPRSGGGLNLLVATTYGRGQFVTRINPSDAALNLPTNKVRDDAFVSGPRVQTVANSTAPGGPTSQLTVVFDGTVDPVTLTAEDITLRDTAGGPIAGVVVAPVPGVPGQPDPRNRYTISFPGQAVPGFYFLQVGGSKDLTVSDLAGNRMNQNGNKINGETFASPNGDDTFSTFVYLNGLANSLFVTGLPSKLSTWAPTPITVTATKADGSVDTGFAGTVSFASSDPNLSLPANYTFAAGDGGRKAFTLTFRSGAPITNPDGTLLAPVTDLVGLFQTVTVNLVADPSNSYNPGQAGSQVYNARFDKAPASLPAAVSAWDPQTLQANLVDYNGNLLPAFAGTVGLASSDGNALLPPGQTYDPASNKGKATFAGITFRTKGVQSVTFGGGPADGVDPLVVKSTVSNAVIDLAGLPAKLSTWDPQTLTVTLKSALPGGPVLTKFAGPRATINLSTTDPIDVIDKRSYTYQPADAGAAKFGLTFLTKGSPTQTVTVAGDIGVDTLTVTPEVVNAQLKAEGLGDPVSTWNPQAVKLSVVSPVTGKVLPAFAGDVTVTSSDPLAAAVGPDTDKANKLATIPAGGLAYTYAAGDAGVRTPTLLFRTGATLSTGGKAQSFTFASPVGIDTLTAGTKVVNAKFVASGLEPTTAGVALDVGLAVTDPLNKDAILPAFVGPVTLGSDDKNATIAPNPFTYTADNAGTKQFIVTYRTSGVKSLTATTPVGVDPFSDKTLVSAAEATRLELGGFPSPAAAGTSGNVTVTAFDKFGNKAAGYTGTVGLAAPNDKQAGGLPATYTFTAADAGSKTFAVSLKTAGTQSITAADAADGKLSAAQTGIVITPGVASQFTLFGYPSKTVAGTGNTLVLKASDAFGNTATDFVGLVKFASSDPLVAPGNGLPTDYTFTAADKGEKVFQAVELRRAGVQSITAASGAISSTQGGITVVAAPAVTYDFTLTSPATIPAGGGVSYQVVARDRFGNQDTNYTGTVQFTSSDPQAGLPSAYTFNANDGGQKGFIATLLTTGQQTITASDPVAGAAGTSGPITVVASATSLLNVAGFPPTVTAGAAGQFSVTLFDNLGNVSTGYAGTVRFSSSDPSAVFALASDPGTPITSYTYTTADLGKQSFVAVLSKAGPQTLTVTPDQQPGQPTVNPGTVSTQVQAAAVASFRVSDFPSPADAGAPRLVRVTALDRFGNTAAGYDGQVRLASSDPAAALPAPGKLTNGTAFFLVTLATAGSQSITASDLLDAAVLGSQTGIQVTGTPVDPTPQPPLVGGLGPVTVTAGGTATAPFTVTTFPLGTGPDGLVYTATSSDAVLVPPGNIVFGGAGGSRSVSATPAAGRTGSATVTVTVTDPATGLSGSQSFGLTVNPTGPGPQPNPADRTNYFAVGTDIGVLNRVSVYNPDATPLSRVEPFAAGFTFGTRPATVRQADGKQLLAAVAGPGRSTELQVLDPASGAVIRRFDGFESSFTGGLFVAAGDVNGDGYEEIAISADQGGGGRVRVLDGKTFEQLADFFGIDDPAFRGGARVAFGDLNGDGFSDLIVTAGFGGGPRVALFDGKTVRPDRAPERLVGDFFVFEQTLRNGVYVTAGDINGDGNAELVVAGGPGGGPRVYALDGKTLLQGQFNPVANYFAGDEQDRGGVRVAVKDLDGDRFGDIVTGDGVGSGTTVRVYFGADLLIAAGNNTPPGAGIEFEENPGATNGVFVG